MNKSLQIASCFFGAIFCVIVLLFGGINFTQNHKVAYSDQSYTGFWLDYTTSFSSGDGKEKSPYEINSAEKLAYLAKMVNAGSTYENSYFRISGNINLTGHNWVPIGNETYPFKGTVYGNGYIISNMIIDSTVMNSGVNSGGINISDYVQSLGLFGYVGSGANITNFSIENALINACENVQNVGTVAGVIEGGSLSNISIVNSTSANTNETTNTGSMIYHKLTTNEGISADFVAGGVVGKLGSGSEFSLDNYDSNEVLTSIISVVTKKNNFSIILGGLVGENSGTLTSVRRTGGTIDAFIGTIGGLVGENKANAKVIDCYNNGNIMINPLLPDGVESVESRVNGQEETVIGGVVGKNYGDISTENFSKNYSTIKGQNITQVFQTCRGSIGGIAGINKGTIKNITNKSSVTCTGGNVQYMGGITAINAGSIYNCENRGNVGGDGNTCFTVTTVGGITGLNDSATTGDGAEKIGNGAIYGAENKAEVGLNIYAENVGGIAGINAGGGKISSDDASDVVVGIIKNSGNTQGKNNVGGIVGKNYGTICYAFNTANVSCSNTDESANVGGVVGVMNNGEIYECFNIGSVLDGYNAGGFVGKMEKGTIKNCINYGDVTGSNGNIGGFAGYFEDGILSKIIAICDVTVKGDAILGVGGVIGSVVLNDNGSNNGKIENYFYSESLANYESDEFGVRDNGMLAIGNHSSTINSKMDSYKMTLPYVGTMGNIETYRTSFYETDAGMNAIWYFNPANESGNTYYYPILRKFKTGETNSLNLYGATASEVTPTNGLAYPSEVIYQVQFINKFPYWNGTAKDHDDRTICDDRYIVSGHCTDEPSINAGDIPAGFNKQWMQTALDQTAQISAPQEWEFTNTITKDTLIYINWVEKVYTVKYYLQLNNEDEFEEMTAEEMALFGLTDSSTFNINPNAKTTLNAIDNTQKRARGYAYDGWWISATASGIGATFDQTQKVSEFSCNTDYAEGIVYVYGTKIAETYRVYLDAGVDNTNIAMKFKNENVGTRKYKDFTYGGEIDLSDIQAELDYNSNDITFKGWFSQESSGGTRYTDKNSIGTKKFDLTGDATIVWYAQWTNKEQEIEFKSIDTKGNEYILGSKKVTYDTAFSYNEFVSLKLKYYNTDEINGYEIDKCYTNSNLSTLFNFDNNTITEQTTLYVTWKKKFFNLILNADGGEFSDGTTQYVIENVEYQSNFLGNILNQLATTQLPARMGYKVKIVNDVAIWNEQASGQGLVISVANNNNKMPANDLNLYAVWEVEKYTVTVVANGGLFNSATGSIPSINISLEYNSLIKQELEKYFENHEKPVYEGYGFRYWSFENAGIDGKTATALSDSDKVPYLGTTVYATWGKQYIVRFKMMFANGDDWRVKEVFEGETVSAPDTSADDFKIAGMDFIDWRLLVGNAEEGEYTTYDWLEPVTSDLTFVGIWQPNGETATPIDTSNVMIIAISIIAGVVVIMFVVILARGHKKDLMCLIDDYKRKTAEKN